MKLQGFLLHNENIFIACSCEHGPWKVGHIGEETAKHSGFITKLSYKNWEGGFGGGKGRSWREESSTMNSCNYKLGSWAWKHLL